MPDLGNLIFMAFRWLLNIALAVLVGYLIWKYWPAIVKAWRELWEMLFGGRRASPAEEAVQTVAPPADPRPFAAFRDPFASGEARRWTPNEVVAYTFAALEAWGAERGLARPPETTPIEFGVQLAREVPKLAEDVELLAQLFSRVAYGKETLKPAGLSAPLARLWSRMTALAAPAPASMAEHS